MTDVVDLATYQGDVRDEDAVDTIVSRVESELGPIDVVVHAAGVCAALGPTWEVDGAQWRADVDTSLVGAYLLVRRVVPGMIARGRGRVIALNSYAAVRSAPHQSAYAAGKAALASLIESLDAELDGTGVRAFSVTPGLVWTEMTTAMAETPWFSALAERRDALPPERVAALVTRIARGDADPLSGRFLHALDDLDDLLAAHPRDRARRAVRAAAPPASAADRDVVRPREVSRTDRSLARRRPLDAEGRVVPADAASGLRNVRMGDEVEHVGVVHERLEPVGASLRDVERSSVLLVEANAVPAEVRRRVRSQVEQRRRRSRRERNARASPPRGEGAGSACRGAFRRVSTVRCSPGRARGQPGVDELVRVPDAREEAPFVDVPVELDDLCAHDGGVDESHGYRRQWCTVRTGPPSGERRPGDSTDRCAGRRETGSSAEGEEHPRRRQAGVPSAQRNSFSRTPTSSRWRSCRNRT